MAESLTWKKPTPAETSTPLTSKGGKWTSCELLWWLFIFPILWLPWDHNSLKLPLCCLSSFTSFFSSESLVPQPWGAPTPFRACFSAASQHPAVSLGTVLAWSRWRPLCPETPCLVLPVPWCTSLPWTSATSSGVWLTSCLLWDVVSDDYHF